MTNRRLKATILSFPTALLSFLPALPAYMRHPDFCRMSWRRDLSLFLAFKYSSTSGTSVSAAECYRRNDMSDPRQKKISHRKRGMEREDGKEHGRM